MSKMFEVYYSAPKDNEREEKITKQVILHGGKLTYREEPSGQTPAQAICLTYEFSDRNSAEKAADSIRKLGEHVENIQEYR